MPFFANRHQITCFLWSLEKNEYAGIKYPINLKHPQKTSIVDDTDSKSRKISLIPIFLTIFKCPCLAYNLPVF